MYYRTDHAYIDPTTPFGCVEVTVFMEADSAAEARQRGRTMLREQPVEGIDDAFWVNGLTIEVPGVTSPRPVKVRCRTYPFAA
jgi:hypothetical protein